MVRQFFPGITMRIIFYFMMAKMVVDHRKNMDNYWMVVCSFYYHKLFQKKIVSFYYHLHYQAYFEPWAQLDGKWAHFSIPKWNFEKSNFFWKCKFISIYLCFSCLEFLKKLFDEIIILLFWFHFFWKIWLWHWVKRALRMKKNGNKTYPL